LPLIDPEICGAVLLLRVRESADYASNAIEASFPKGLDCEVFTAVEVLAAAAAETSDAYDLGSYVRRTSRQIFIPAIRRWHGYAGPSTIPKTSPLCARSSPLCRRTLPARWPMFLR